MAMADGGEIIDGAQKAAFLILSGEERRGRVI